MVPDHETRQETSFRCPSRKVIAFSCLSTVARKSSSRTKSMCDFGSVFLLCVKLFRLKIYVSLFFSCRFHLFRDEDILGILHEWWCFCSLKIIYFLFKNAFVANTWERFVSEYFVFRKFPNFNGNGAVRCLVFTFIKWIIKMTNVGKVGSRYECCIIDLCSY